MAYYSWRYYFNSPQDLLQNEWIIFAGIFLLTFAVIFYSLRDFLGKKGEKFFDFSKGKYSTNKNDYVIPAIISGVIAFFTAASVSRYGPFYDYFAAILGVWMLLFVLIVMFIISLPFFKALKYNFGNKWYFGGFGGVLLAIAYWYFFNSYFFYDAFSYSFSGWSYNAFNFISSSSGLTVLIILFALLGAFLPVRRRI